MTDTFSIVPDNVQETWEWKTDILSTQNGSESRLSLYPAPRVTQVSKYKGFTQEERRNVYRVLAEDLSNPDSIPMWAWGSRLTAASSSGTNTISLDSIRAQLSVGDRVVLLNPVTEVNEDFVLTAVTSTTATLDSNLSQDVGASWLAFKAMTALIVSPKMKFNTVAGDFTFTAKSWIEPYVQWETPTATLSTLDGLPVLDRYASEGGTEDPEFENTVTDFGIGRRTISTRHTNIDIKGRRRYWVNRRDNDDVEYWKLFLDTVRGAWKAFLMSTQLQDMTLSAPLVQAGTTMTINEQDVDSLFHDFESFKHFEIEYDDGTSSQHTITNSISGTVTFTPALPNDPKVSDIKRISYLLKVRMSDRLQWRHGPVTSYVSFDFMTTDDG